MGLFVVIQESGADELLEMVMGPSEPLALISTVGGEGEGIQAVGTTKDSVLE